MGLRCRVAVALRERLAIVDQPCDRDSPRALGQREGMISRMNDVESLQLQVLDGDMSGARHHRCGGAAVRLSTLKSRFMQPRFQGSHRMPPGG